MASGHPEDEYTSRERLEYAGGSILRIALLFGSVSIALAMIVTHLLDKNFSGNVTQTESASSGLDFGSTASIGEKGRYIIRKSVLQPDPNSVCIIRENGTYSGDC
jgi:hypothetical protein